MSNQVSNLVNSATTQDVIAVLVFVAIVAVLVYTKRVPQAKKIVLAVVLQAEAMYGAKTGDTKYAYVTGLIYPKLPLIVRLFVTEKTVGDWIEEAVGTLKDKLQVNVSKSIVTPKEVTEADTNTTVSK